MSQALSSHNVLLLCSQKIT